MSINISEALKTVNEKIEIISKESGIELKLLEEKIIGKPFYWVFFYNPKLYLEEGNLSSA